MVLLVSGRLHHSDHVHVLDRVRMALLPTSSPGTSTELVAVAIHRRGHSTADAPLQARLLQLHFIPETHGHAPPHLLVLDRLLTRTRG